MDLAALYRDIAETSTDGVWVIDLEGNTVWANQTVARMYGIPHSEVGALTVFDTLDELGRRQFATHLERVRAGSYAEEVETLFHDRTGRATWILVRESLLRDVDGQVTAIVHRISDHDAQRRLSDELVESRNRLQEAQQIARLGAWSWDPHSHAIHATGYDGEALDVDATSARFWFADFLAEIHPHDRDRVVSAVNPDESGHDQFEFDVRFTAGDEPGWMWVRARGVLVRDTGGALSRVTGTYQDVDAVKRIEQALRIERDHNAVLREVVTAANEADNLTEAVVGICDIARQYLLDDQVAGFVVQDDRLLLVSGSDRPELAAMATVGLQAGSQTFSDDTRGVAVAVTAENAARAAIVYEQPTSIRSDRMERTAEIIARQLARVAERDVARDALARARDAATAASRQKSEFLATMSHEIRTPLNGVIGLNDLLARSDLDPDQERLADGVQAASRKLLRIINDVLDFSAFQAGGVALQQVDFDLRPLLDDVARGLVEQSREAGVELVLTCAQGVPATLTGDPARLAQMLTNLTSNAVKFSRAGEVLVTVSAPAQPAGHRSATRVPTRLRVEVRDTGIGIEPDQLGHLLAAFTQGDATSTRSFGGTGLGLAITREIVRAMGGEIGYEPNPAGGSIFWFTADFAVPEQDGDGIDTYARTWLQGRRVLVMDDHPLRRRALDDLTSWWSMRALVVATPAEAMAELAASVAEGDPYEGLLIGSGSDDGPALALAHDVAENSAYDAITMVLLSGVADIDMRKVRGAGISVCLPRPTTAATVRGTLLEQLAGVSATPVTPEPVTTTRVHGPRRSVLVVEDNPVNQLVATGLLRSMGVDVDVADDGLAAVEILAARRYDAVLMDVQMPVLDGYATTRRLRERGVRTPIIALTAAAVDGERDRCLASGMDDFLTKPIEPALLRARLQQWWGLSDLDDDPEPVLPPTPPFPGLDTSRLDMLRDLDPGDTTYLDRAIGNFQVNSVEALAQVRESLAVGDLAAVRAAAHKIAGSALNLGVPPAGEAARIVELAAEDGSADLVGELLPNFEDTMLKARNLLLTYQATYTEVDEQD